MAPWWLRASDDEHLADSPAELEAFAQEEEPILGGPAEAAAPPAPAEPWREPLPPQLAAAEESDEDAAEAEDSGDEAGDAEAGDADSGDAEAKSGGVRRRRRRRRGRRGDAAAAPAAEPVKEAAKVPLFDSPPSRPNPEHERAPLLASAPARPQETADWQNEPEADRAEAAARPPAERAAEVGGLKMEPFRLFVPPVSSVEPPTRSRGGRQSEPYFDEPSAAEPAEPFAAAAPPAPAPAEPAESRPAPPAARRPSPSARPAPPAAPAYPAYTARPSRGPEPRGEHGGYGPPDHGGMQMETLPKAYVYTVPERPSSPADERKIAMFVDFENIALGVRDSEVRTFDMTLILERLLEKGKIIVKKAYADWERYSEYKRPFHEAAIELIDIPQKFYSGKNSADIKMVVDAMDLCYSKEHLDTFVLVSGDSDFSPLVSKLKENNKYVIGLGVKNSSSSLLIDNCDEFIYYEDVWRDTQRVPRLDHLAPKEAECFQLMCESIVALLRENKELLWGSLVKQTMQRKRPSFSEGYYGYGTFTELLEDAERKNIIRLRRDQRSGTYIVIGFVPPRSKRSFQV